MDVPLRPGGLCDANAEKHTLRNVRDRPWKSGHRLQRAAEAPRWVEL
mgnify:CR=1 FL=1